MNRLDRMEKKIKDSTKQYEPNFIRASSAELDMYIECRKAGRIMPEEGSDEYWELFDQVNDKLGSSRCPRELMQQYLDRERKPESGKCPELDRRLEERRIIDHILPLDADL